MAVGVDIDDTVLFFSPGFWRGKKTFSPESEDYLKNPVFWEKMNNGWDEFSIPKEVALHQLLTGLFFISRLIVYVILGIIKMQCPLNNVLLM